MTKAVGAQAVVWRGGAGFSVESSGVSLPRPTDMLVRVLKATVCGSDRHSVSGMRRSPCPSVLGHEAVGVVEELGHSAARPGVMVGDRVVWGVTDSCGECARCGSGMTAKCESLRKTGHEEISSTWGKLSGSYSTHIVLPKGVTVVKVPDSVSDEAASMSGCALATIMACRDAAGGFGGKSVLVLGAGMLGVCASAVAATCGARQVVVCDVDVERLKMAAAFGSTEQVEPHALSHRLFDVVVEVSGHHAAVQQGLAAVGLGGVVVFAGSVFPVRAAQIDPQRIVRGWQTVTGVHNYEPRHLVQAVDFLASTSWDWSSVMGAPVSLEQVPKVLVHQDRSVLREVVDCAPVFESAELPVHFDAQGNRV